MRSMAGSTRRAAGSLAIAHLVEQVRFACLRPSGALWRAGALGLAAPRRHRSPGCRAALCGGRLVARQHLRGRPPSVRRPSCRARRRASIGRSRRSVVAEQARVPLVLAAAMPVIEVQARDAPSAAVGDGARLPCCTIGAPLAVGPSLVLHEAACLRQPDGSAHGAQHLPCDGLVQRAEVVDVLVVVKAPYDAAHTGGTLKAPRSCRRGLEVDELRCEHHAGRARPAHRAEVLDEQLWLVWRYGREGWLVPGGELTDLRPSACETPRRRA